MTVSADPIDQEIAVCLFVSKSRRIPPFFEISETPGGTWWCVVESGASRDITNAGCKELRVFSHKNASQKRRCNWCR